MNGGIPVGRLFGIEVRLSPAWIVLAAVVTFVGAQQAAIAAPAVPGIAHWALGALVAGGFLISVLAHELTHALVGRRVGVTVDQVVVGFAGGFGASIGQADHPKGEAAIALSGPILSLVLAAALLPVATALALVGGAMMAVAGGLLIVGGLNLVLGVLSIIPGVPLDGARAVRAVAWARTGDRHRAGRVTARVSKYMGWIVLGGGIATASIDRLSEGLLVMALGWVLLRSSQGLNRRLDIEALLVGATVADAVVTDGPVVGPNLTVDTFANEFERQGGVVAVPVVDEGTVLGVIGVRRLQRLGRRKFAATRAADVMTSPPQAPILALAEPLWDAAELMDRLGIDGLAVATDGALEGMVTSQSIGRLVRQRRGAPETVVNS